MNGPRFALAVRLLVPVLALLSRPAAARAQSVSSTKVFHSSSDLAAPDKQHPISRVAARAEFESKIDEDHENKLWTPFLKHAARDQQEFWQKPFHLNRHDARLLLPFAALTGALLAGDRWLSRQTPTSAVAISRSKTVSDYSTYAFVGTVGGAYLWGHLAGNDHLRETGFLAAEAAFNATAVTYFLKGLSQRPRPFEDQGLGPFFQGGASFPSEHSAIAWSVASVVAHEYPGTLTKIAAYGLASTVTLTRVTGRQHFPSDVVVGSALGWYFAHQVYRRRHDPAVGGTGWNTVYESDSEDGTGTASGERMPDVRRMGSSNVPLESWIYPALERLSAFGYIDQTFSGMKPWTRLECAAMVELAGEHLERSDNSGQSEMAGLVLRLEGEFFYEAGLLDGKRNLSATIDSVYARTVSISGPDLADSYHFGQTVSSDFGRPFERGTNGQTGMSVRAEAGPVAIFINGEFEHAPSAPAPSATVLKMIALKDSVPLPPAVGVDAINRPQLLDSYVSLNLGVAEADGWQLTLGRRSHSWGPGLGGSFLLSTNAAPIDMIEVANQEPIRLPLLSKFLGPIRTDQFIGRLAGRSDHARPWVFGQKISFHPLPNLEIGYGRMTTIGGSGGDPFTTQNFVLSLFGQVNARLRSIPGDSDNEMDWTFTIPKTKHYVIFYGEVYAEDDFVAWVRPGAYPFRPGIYLTHFPGLPKLDLHVEAASTEAPGWRGSGGSNQGQFIYFDSRYHQADTNRGFLLGNPVGRMGQAIQGWLTYWASPRNILQLTYKNNFVDSAFIPGGGAWQDYALRYEGELRSGWYMKAETQFEHISRYPLLFSAPVSNVTAMLELGIRPNREKR